MYKHFLFLIIAVVPALGQSQSADLRKAAGCGPMDAKFSVKTEKNRHALVSPTNDKALVYVIMQEISDPKVHQYGHVTTRVGLDGNWVGANHGPSYLSFSMDPGKHHVCADVQSIMPGTKKLNDAVDLTAEAGETYFYSAELTIPWQDHPANLVLQPLDQGKGELLIAQTASSTSAMK